MKEKLLEIMKRIEAMEKDFDYTVFETAIYLYLRYGKDTVEILDDEELDEIYNVIQGQHTIFNEDLNDYFESNFEV